MVLAFWNGIGSVNPAPTVEYMILVQILTYFYTATVDIVDLVLILHLECFDLSWQVLTNGKYKSVPHQAVVNATQSRISSAYFYEALPSTVIVPHPDLVDENNPLQYEPFTGEAYRVYKQTQFLNTLEHFVRKKPDAEWELSVASTTCSGSAHTLLAIRDLHDTRLRWWRGWIQPPILHASGCRRWSKVHLP